jgi:hypothetical protein
MEELNDSLKEFSAGDTVSITVYRQSTETQFEIALLLDESSS